MLEKTKLVRTLLGHLDKLLLRKNVLIGGDKVGQVIFETENEGSQGIVGTKLLDRLLR